MGIYDEKLGEYKVALSVDYKKFHEGMKSAMDLMTETAGIMNRTAEDLSACLALHFDTMTKTVNTGVESMKADINSLTEMLKGGNDIKGFSNSLETELKRITEKYKAAVKEIQTEIGKTVNVPDSGSSGGGKSSDSGGKKSSDSVSEYTKRTRLRSKGASEVAETGAVSDETIKAYNEVDTNIKKAETSLNAIRKAQNDLNKLAEQYNAIQQKVANTITAQGKLSDTTLASYRSQIANITQEYQRLAGFIGSRITSDFSPIGLMPNYLAKGGAYEQNAKKVDRDAEESERIKSLDKLRNKYRELYAEVQQRIRETARLSERQFNSMNRQIDKVVMEMRRLGDRSAVNPLAEQFGRNYGGYIKSFNDNLKESVKTTNMLVDGFTSLKHHIMWMVSATALATTVGIPASVVASYKDTERQMAGMIQVLPQLHHNQSELNRTATEFIGIAQRYGMSVHDIIEAGKLWGRGYKETATIMQLTSLSAKLAVADMMDVGLANRAVESVINSYQQQANAIEFATHVVDSWTKIAHNAQSSATDLADALMRAGAAAQAVGVDFDTTNALASTMIKVTGRTGAEVGNALKSLFSSIHNDKAIKSLEELGVSVYEFAEDGTKHFRNLQDVFIDLMLTSHTTSKNMERDLLAISGGKFQWSKVAGILGDYEDFIKSYYLSIESAGFVNDQVGAQLDTLEAKIQQLKSTWAGFAQNVGTSGLGESLKGLLDYITRFIRGLQQVPAWVFQVVGSMVKWSAIIWAASKAVGALTAVYISAKAVITGATVATVANTVATNAGTVAKNLNKGSIISRIASLVAEKIATVGATMATQAENAALAENATLMTVATGGLNILAAALLTATVGTIAYANSLGEEAQALEDVRLKEEAAHQATLQEIANYGEQERFGEKLINNYYKLRDALATMTEGDEKSEKVKRDLIATEEVLINMIGQEGFEAVKQAKDEGEAINILKGIIEGKANALKDATLDAINASIEETKAIIQDSKDRIEQIKNEIPVWQSLANAVAEFNLQGVKAALTRAYFGKSREAREADEKDIIANAEAKMKELEKRSAEVQEAFVKNRMNAQPDAPNGEVTEKESGGSSGGGSGEVDAYREAMREFREALAKAKYDAESQGNYFSKTQEYELFKEIMGDSFVGETRFGADLLNKQRAGEKEQRDIANSNYDVEYFKRQLNSDFSKAIETSIAQTVEAGKPLSKSMEKLRRLIDEVNFAYKGSPEHIKAMAKLYEAELQQQTQLEKNIRTIRENGIKSLETMADKELEFAKSLGLVNDSDIRRYKEGRNEQEHSRNMPYLENELMKTAQAGMEEEILSAYHAFKMAQTQEDVEYSARYLMSLSGDINATKSAIDAMIKEDERYHQEKYRIETENFKESAKYALAAKDAFVSSFEDGLNGILERTMSFGEAMRNIFKNIAKSIIHTFTKEIGEKLNKILAKALFKEDKSDNIGGALIGHLGGSVKVGGKKSSGLSGLFGSIPMPTMNFMGGGGKKAMNPMASLTSGLDKFQTSLANVKGTWTNTMGTMSTTASATANVMSNFVTEGVNTFTTGEIAKRTASSTTAASVMADGAATQTSVTANIGAMVAQMLAAMAIMFVLSSLFGGGGSSTSTSTSEFNLGRAPDSYYMTPTPVMQSTTFNVPSFDIGGNIEQDMFAMVHKGEMVLTPEQADVIRNTATSGGSLGGGANATVKSNISVSTVDSRGFDRVLKNYNRTLSKQVKSGIRNGFLNAKGLV